MTPRSAKILVAEDDDAIRKLLEVPLRAAGYSVTATVDGLAALQAFDQQSFDVAIVDLMMPRLDGMKLLRAIKSHGRGHATEVIILSAKADPRAMIQGLDLGARLFITKPFAVAELLEKIDQILTGKR